MMVMVEGALGKPKSWEPPNAATTFNWATRTPLPSGADAKSTRIAVLTYTYQAPAEKTRRKYAAE